MLRNICSNFATLYKTINCIIANELSPVFQTSKTISMEIF